MLIIALLIGACRINFSDFVYEIWLSLRYYATSLRGRRQPVEDKGWNDEMVALRASGP
jgi:hypothetical protein